MQENLIDANNTYSLALSIQEKYLTSEYYGSLRTSTHYMSKRREKYNMSSPKNPINQILYNQKFNSVLSVIIIIMLLLMTLSIISSISCV